MQECKRILAHEKIHLQLPPKLQRSKASNYHQQIRINGKLETLIHAHHNLLSSETYNRHKKFLTNEFINIIKNNAINHLITLHIIDNFQEEIEARRKIQHFLKYHQEQQYQLGNDYLRQ